MSENAKPPIDCLSNGARVTLPSPRTSLLVRQRMDTKKSPDKPAEGLDLLQSSRLLLVEQVFDLAPGLIFDCYSAVILTVHQCFATAYTHTCEGGIVTQVHDHACEIRIARGRMLGYCQGASDIC